MRCLPPEVAVDFVLDVLLREGTAWVREAGESMAPLVRAGDLLRLVPVDPGRVRAGDLIAFRQGEALVVHRVLRRTRARVLTKGDALARADAPVAAPDVLARVVAVRTPAGRSIDFTRPGWRLVGRLLARCSELHARAGPLRRALRVPFRLAARLAR